MTRGVRPLKGELIPFGPGSLKPGAVIIYLTPRIEAYLRELMRTGFYGHGVPDTCERLICRGIETAIAKGIIPHKGPLKGRE
ncbi:MAG: hypothetical protein NUW14_10855 [Deltaproteobacteria bacterium]|nr:hypothetical protein [Deltaproteobacteria bacterium]